ncbi:ATP-binding cassette domain-containing protein [Paraburkholderia sp. CNPSo 3157]|uniref:ATP-binding cassette domain-containing protein n=1 Tax=Paraburkholderia franconis TaxID=2654983 RepID=A0A7X1TL38_9BURK|nr:ATP-binding cassette domain-containing protein [Paraburkholderia franconis]MPW23382.1 ATP-binding cassette domain-containing protein [Paraburkholderia franconis]
MNHPCYAADHNRSEASTAGSKSLVLEAVSKRFGNARALDTVTLHVEPGELVSLLGPSGCGKTTTLCLIAGFDFPDTGTVHIGGVDVSALPPNKRGLGMVFQNYSLFPHMTVGENIGFGLRMAGAKKAERQTVKETRRLPFRPRCFRRAHPIRDDQDEASSSPPRTAAGLQRTRVRGQSRAVPEYSTTPPSSDRAAASLNRRATAKKLRAVPASARIEVQPTAAPSRTRRKAAVARLRQLSKADCQALSRPLALVCSPHGQPLLRR